MWLSLYLYILVAFCSSVFVYIFLYLFLFILLWSFVGVVNMLDSSLQIKYPNHCDIIEGCVVHYTLLPSVCDTSSLKVFAVITILYFALAFLLSSCSVPWFPILMFSPKSWLNVSLTRTYITCFLYHNPRFPLKIIETIQVPPWGFCQVWCEHRASSSAQMVWVPLFLCHPEPCQWFPHHHPLQQESSRALCGWLCTSWPHSLPVDPFWGVAYLFVFRWVVIFYQYWQIFSSFTPDILFFTFCIHVGLCLHF